MTQVPEYLLERSRARRAALGLGGGSPAPAPSGDGGAGAAPAPVAAAAPAVEATSGPIAPSAPAAPTVPSAPLPEYVTDPGPKSGIPFWMMPIILMLPLWAVVYMGAFGSNGSAAAAPTPAALFASNCAVCHGATGGGGVGPKLAGGEAKLTFPEEADHIAWVTNGSASKKGQPYGDPNRPGGQHIASTGGMPAFGGQLSPAAIQQIVEYERNVL